MEKIKSKKATTLGGTFQKETGFEIDGIIDLGEVIFLPRYSQVTEEIASIGTIAGGGVIHRRRSPPRSLPAAQNERAGALPVRPPGLRACSSFPLRLLPKHQAAAAAHQCSTGTST